MKYTIAQIREEAAKEKWSLLSEEYKNLDSPLTFCCPEGHKVMTTYKKWRTKQSCPICEQNPYKNMNCNSSIPIKAKGEHRILAVDQSSHKNGACVFSGQKLIHYEAYESTKGDSLERMVDLSEWLTSLIKNWEVDVVGFEDTQYNANFGTGHNIFKLLSQVMGALMLTAARQKVKVETVMVATWRHHSGVKGNKRADQKRSAQLLVKKLYDISVVDDISDAILIGKYFSDKYKEDGQVVIGEWV